MKYTISSTSTIRQALFMLDQIGVTGTVLFVIDDNNLLLGTLTDGDIRRGLLKDADINTLAIKVANPNFIYATQTSQEDDISSKVAICKQSKIRFLPVLGTNKTLINIIDIQSYLGFLPLHAIIMAGGRGQRLLPLTASLPKPMLNVGEKPIIEHNIDRLIKFGIENISISINYLGHIISNYFGDGKTKGINIDYIQETTPLGTMGSTTLKINYNKDYILLMNSDLLTNIDFNDFYNEFINNNADLSIASIPYHSDIPYAVFELTNGNNVKSFKEKPRYTYYANAGIYLFKKELLSLIPKGQYFDATDFIQLLIDKRLKVTTYPILGYWLDIGRMNDFVKAQEDIKHIQL